MTAEDSRSRRALASFRNTPRSVAVSLLVLLPVLVLSCRTQTQTEKAPQASPSPQAEVKLEPTVAPTPIYDHPYQGRGIVQINNRKEGWVEIKHGEIEGLMPAMTMEFWVLDRSILKGIRVGDKVDFVVVDKPQGQYVIKLARVKSSH